MAADWLPLAAARERILAGVAPLNAERAGLADALGRVLAEAVVSPIDLPLRDNSAMDGFAVREEDVRGASPEQPRRLRVVGDLPAGSVPDRGLAPGEAQAIATGGPLPDGADSVVRIEHTEADGGWIRILRDSDAGRNVRRRGEDVRTGRTVLEPGAVVGPAEAGLAAGVGVAELRVVRRPEVAVLASGDELVPVSGFAEVRAGRRIVSTNSYTLAAQLTRLGMRVRDLGIAPDDPDRIARRIRAARGCDALVTTAGVSVGARDHLRGVLAGMGISGGFWRVRIRPGSPFAFGTVDGLGGIPWFGLPGNPVSAMVTFEILARPALLRMAGRSRIFHRVIRATLPGPPARKEGLVHFLRVRLDEDAPVPVAALTGSQGSGILTSLVGADGLLVAEGGSPQDGRFPVALLDAASPRLTPGYP